MNTRYSERPENNSVSNSPLSSIVSEDEKLVDKYIQNMEIKTNAPIPPKHLDTKPKVFEIDVSGEEMFMRNLDKINSGRFLGETGQQPDEFSAHRFTLQGSEGFFEGERLSEVMERPMRDMISDEPEKTHDIRQSQQKALEIIPPSTLAANENLFSPTYALYPEFDLSQYNSPSFAAGNHIQSNYHSLSRFGQN